jgi:hypothetical protein
VGCTTGFNLVHAIIIEFNGNTTTTTIVYESISKILMSNVGCLEIIGVFMKHIKALLV